MADTTGIDPLGGASLCTTRAAKGVVEWGRENRGMSRRLAASSKCASALEDYQ
jgi:hypothetical protein